MKIVVNSNVLKKERQMNIIKNDLYWLYFYLSFISFLVGMGFTVGLVSPPLLSFTRISFLNQTFSMQFFLWIRKGAIQLLINSLIFDSFIPYILTASHFKNLTIAEKIFTSALGSIANDSGHHEL